ncbi:MAG: hypothetical protein ABF289_19030 [Clostridiales bacterium]
MKKNIKWLFVFDNVYDEKIQSELLEKYTINTNNGKAIITSRFFYATMMKKVMKYMNLS